MKNAIILHGGYSSPNHYWYPSIKQFLESHDYEVWAPQLPGEEPDLANWLPFTLKNGKFNDNTLLISHSLGSALALAALEKINTKIYKAILVSGFSKPRGDFKEKMLQEKYNWEKIKANVKDLILINSGNDPWGCNEKQGLYLWEKLGGTLILREGEGHMGSESFGQNYSRFYLLEKLIELDFSRQSINSSDKK